MTASFLRSIALPAERFFDAARFQIKRRTGRLGRPMLLAYRGFGVPEGVWIKGRVIEDQGVRSAGRTASTLTNIWLTLKRYETDEVGGATIAYAFEDCDGELVEGMIRTDREGYFDATIPCRIAPTTAPWLLARLELKAAPGYEISPLGAKCEVRMVSDRARYGVISDIDDTIVHTGATNFIKHWRTVVANSAESRTAFPGVTHFYRGLAKGADGDETNPFFYVSSSPWNLFDLFERFMILHRIPVGTMLLKDFGLDADKWLTGGHDGHKLNMIARVLDAHRDLPFILIGDSGQRDAAIYAEIAAKYPRQIVAVHIRDVTGGIYKTAVSEALEAIEENGVDVTIAPTMQEAADHAVARGWVSADVADDVARAIAARERDDREPAQVGV